MSPGPSILFLNRVLPPMPGATGRIVADMAARLAESGWRVTIVSDGGADEPCDPPGVAVMRTGAGGVWPGAAGYLAAMMRVVRRALLLPRHDLVVTMTDPPLLCLLGPLLRLRHGAAVHWSQDLYPELLEVAGRAPPPVVVRLLARLSTAALRRHDAVVTIGPGMARRLADRGVPRDRLHVLPNWAQPSLAPRPPDAARSPGFTVLYAGTLGLVHPVDTLVGAAMRLLRSRPEVRFVVVAGGRRRDGLARAVERHGLANLVLLPRQSEGALRDLAAGADVHLALLDARAGGLLVPCKVQAAFASGRPVILAGPGDCDAARTIRESGAGWIVPPEGGDRLAALVEHLCGNPVAVADAATAASVLGAGWTADMAAAQFARICRATLHAAGHVGVRAPAPLSAPEVPHG